MEEVIAAAAAEGVAMPPDVVRRQVDSTREMGAYRTSMQVDRHERRPLEVEAILGEPLRRAANGVATPLLDAIYRQAVTLDQALR